MKGIVGFAAIDVGSTIVLQPSNRKLLAIPPPPRNLRCQQPRLIVVAPSAIAAQPRWCLEDGCQRIILFITSTCTPPARKTGWGSCEPSVAPKFIELFVASITTDG